MSLIEKRIHVGKKGVANLHRSFRRLNDRGPDIGFLRIGGKDVVVAVKGEECRELHPSIAELHVGISVETAGICAEHRDAEDSERESLRNGKKHRVPF